jgi:hypothetical protein
MLEGMDRRWPVHVVATTRQGTRSALTRARRLTEHISARIVLIVPRPASRAKPFDPAGGERVAIVDDYLALAAEVGVEITVLFCICRRIDDIVRQMLGGSSLVIVGGTRRLWWPSREQRLTERLSRSGCAVVFADAGLQ